MRSEERAGIITTLMLFLWGTLIAEPFHIFARYIASSVTYVIGKTGAGDIITSLVLYLAVVCVIVLMLKLARTKISIYMPCAISVIFIAMLVARSFVRHSVDYKDSICLAPLRPPHSCHSQLSLSHSPRLLPHPTSESP